jgi:hypothetical protein
VSAWLVVPDNQLVVDYPPSTPLRTLN